MFAGIITAAVLVSLMSAPVEPLPIPAPQQPVLLPDVGATADRLRVSVLPPGATATDTEAVAVGLAGGGGATAVTVEQRIALAGHGDYVVVERGPARRAEVLGDGDPPSVKAGAVLYAGFLPPTGRLLASRLTLDPTYEQSRLPMRVTLSFTPTGARGSQPLGSGGLLPGPGVLTVSLVNTSGTLATVSTGDAPAQVLAGPLDALSTTANRPGARPPVAGDGLPTSLGGASGVTQVATEVTAPLKVTGTMVLSDPAGRPITDAQLSGDGVTPAAGGGRIAGILTDGATFRLMVPAAGRAAMDLSAVPALDPRSLVPPAPADSWSDWASRRPPEAERRAAVDAVELAAAQAAHIRQISPYLTTGLPGSVTTTFDYRLTAPPAAAPTFARPLHRRPWVLVLFAIAGLLVITTLELLRRRL